LLKLKTDDYQVIKYLEVELNKKNLTEIINKINTSSSDVLRKNEIIYKNLDLGNINLSIDKIVDIIILNPILLQRPLIAKYENNELAETIIARPPKEILSILD
jgi:arsenate reductase